LNELALFAGAGGGLLASILLGWRVVCAVEKDRYCRRVLLQRQKDGLLPLFPVWDDVQDFEGEPWRGKVQVVTAGFPCQPFSSAGKRLGEKDERNMWPHTIRILREVGAEWALLENVPGLVTSGYFGTILSNLAEAGFDAEWDVFSAADDGAPHFRERLWIVAHAQCAERGAKTQEGDEPNVGDTPEIGRRQEHTENKVQKRRASPDRANFMAHTLFKRQSSKRWPSPPGCQQQKWEPPRIALTERERKRLIGLGIEPGLGGSPYGVAYRVDRLKAIGNGQVPSVAVRAWMELSGRF
jgi:DNA (cytosine-5)-methyltransferase 1